FLENHWYKVYSAASAMGQFDSIPEAGRRAFFTNMMRSMVETGQFVANAWTIWDSDVLSNDAMAAQAGAPGTDEQGRFVAGYVRNRSRQITMHLRRDFETDEFYLLPKKLNRQILTNPYDRELAGELRNIATISSPIRNSANQIVGVIGLDIDLAQLNVIGQKFERFFPGTLAAAFSNDGTIVSHFLPQNIGRNVMETEGEILGDLLRPFADAVRRGEEKRFNLSLGGQPHWFFVVPVPVSNFPETWAFAIAIPLNVVRENTHAMITFAIVICVLMMALVILSAVLLSRSVSRPIKNMAHILKDIAQGDGDLTVRLPETGKDEIAEASRYFNLTIGKIKDLIVTIKHQAGALSGIGNDLSSNMMETASAMNEISANIQSIKERIINQSSSVTETNATMEQVTANINKLNSHVERQTSAISESSSAIEQMLANIQSVTSTLVKNTANMRELQESSETGKTSLQEVVSDIRSIARESEGLLEINSVMENIASQTNLLSMNAAIEAAHAGEAGRGFAVVADEIRKLAESSSEQSKTIGTVLKKIKESIDKITFSTDKVLTKFESIESGVKTVAEQEDIIRTAMEEQSQGSKQILGSAGQVSEITQQVKSGSAEMLNGSKEVIREGKNLEMATQEITHGINEMAAGTGEINNAVNNINELTCKNRENISSLVDSVSRFKV
ncbi:MAG: methyl-accepting chemotaxis protein, partial [Treponema sp.]|nr:methyl-accepting chemotaxis protein [Treponema sp.]